MRGEVVSATLFVRDVKAVADFYRDTFSASALAEDESHVVLNCAGFELVVHQIPRSLLPGVSAGEPILRRERSAIRLTFPVRDLAQARRSAQARAGVIDTDPPAWAGTDRRFFLGQDPEGNVFGIRVLQPA